MKKINGLKNIIRYMIENDLSKIDDGTPELYFDKENNDYILRSRKKKDGYGLGIDIIYYGSNVCFEFDVFISCLEIDVFGKTLIETIQKEVSRPVQIQIAKAIFADNTDYGEYIVDDDLVCFYQTYEM